MHITDNRTTTVTALNIDTRHTGASSKTYVAVLIFQPNRDIKPPHSKCCDDKSISLRQGDAKTLQQGSWPAQCAASVLTAIACSIQMTLNTVSNAD